MRKLAGLAVLPVAASIFALSGSASATYDDPHVTASVACVDGEAILTVTARPLGSGWVVISGTGTFDKGTSTPDGRAYVYERRGKAESASPSHSYVGATCS